MTLGSVLYLMLVVAMVAGSGWLGWSLAQKPGSRKRGTHQQYAKDYFVGLNYLINDEPDDAIDIFIHSLEANSSSIEAHLALGALLRRRGKVDRSVSVYQQLLARAGLSEAEINQIRVDLTKSYISAGLLDRAEKLVEQLKRASKEFRQQGLALAINLYQMERDWPNAVKSAEDLLALCPARERSHYQQMASHFHCEIAEQEMAAGQFRASQQALKSAYYLYRNNVRVSILSAQVEMHLENYREAVAALLRVQQQDPDFYPDVFPTLLDCYQKQSSPRQFARFLENSLEGNPAPGVLLTVSEHIGQEKGGHEALQFLLQRLQQQPSLLLMNRALQILGKETNESKAEREACELLHQVLDDYLKKSPAYRCSNCGFEGRMLHWSCPGCSSWGTNRPVRAVAGVTTD